MISKTYRVDHGSLSHEKPTISSDIVFLPIIQCGKFAGWTVKEKRHFTDEELKSIQKEIENEKENDSSD